jgi:hypothetical protein
VSGAETYATSIDVSKVTSSEIHIHYVPGVHAGSLVFEVDGLASDRSIVASGASAQVAIVDGKAVDATVALGLGPQPDLGALANGDKCTMGADCASQFCVDGVCCDTACTGTCEACNLPGTAGTCSPIPANTDPDQECGAKIPPPPPDGGVGDGGLGDGGFGDGGAPNLNLACAGTCSGARSCQFPGTDTPCGASSCTPDSQLATLVCDGTGACEGKTTSCSGYACDLTNPMCKTTCAQKSDCATGSFCNSNDQCVPQKPDGQSCTMDAECGSGFCVGVGSPASTTNKVCCNSGCSGPGFQCSAAGACQCGASCPAGVACRVFYRDSDGDTYGDPNTSKAIPGCQGDAAPPGYALNNQDCDDGDANAHPECNNDTNPCTSTPVNYQTTPSKGTGSFDYNCSGGLDKGLAEFPSTATCHFCYLQFPSIGCGNAATCSTAGNQGDFACGAIRCFGSRSAGFVTSAAGGIPCGQFATWYQCGTCSVAGGTAGYSANGTMQQTCK